MITRGASSEKRQSRTPFSSHAALVHVLAQDRANLHERLAGGGFTGSTEGANCYVTAIADVWAQETAAAVWTAGERRISIGCLFQYVSERQHHSSGPNQ